MKQLRLRDLVSLLESHGFTLLRSNGHMVYGCGVVRIALAHDRMVSPAVVREAYKAISKVELLNQVKAA